MAINSNLSQSELDYSKALRGIRTPVITTLPAGLEVFRFASSVRPGTGETIASTDWSKSPWWSLKADYYRILARHKAGALSLGTVARSATAVQPSWSRMDILISARLKEDTEAYQGKGKTQYRDLLPNGMYMTLTGWPDITQLYIPKYQHSLWIVQQEVITTDRFGF
jgi:hypothetical protein